MNKKTEQILMIIASLLLATVILYAYSQQIDRYGGASWDDLSEYATRVARETIYKRLFM